MSERPIPYRPDKSEVLARADGVSKAIGVNTEWVQLHLAESWPNGREESFSFLSPDAFSDKLVHSLPGRVDSFNRTMLNRVYGTACARFGESITYSVLAPNGKIIGEKVVIPVDERSYFEELTMGESVGGEFLANKFYASLITQPIE